MTFETVVTALVLLFFGSFAVTLFIVAWWSSQAPRTAPMAKIAPARRPASSARPVGDKAHA